ncbi:DUF4296 domain-containing protein [Pedobacter sp. LMG 31464]|uniref:DUF4296 domain-containing protein n=1 Tax=Pedobacter planticolens TaxID=2679964 RepID=A0A923DWT9_9SPHI|nr:DUF4296 domain-containing protein [Pedobacter planticolens]MBB2144550.1 DUF4296 domain-containing protein [Pedobacter planticolens]
MKRFFVILILCALFYACKPGIPKDIIQPDKMEKVLHDIHVADGYSSSFPQVDSAKKVISSLYKGIYQKFGIDSALYNQSLDYYYKHPDVMKKMYDNISANLTKERESLTRVIALESSRNTLHGAALLAPPPKRLDSTFKMGTNPLNISSINYSVN